MVATMPAGQFGTVLAQGVSALIQLLSPVSTTPAPPVGSV